MTKMLGLSLARHRHGLVEQRHVYSHGCILLCGPGEITPSYILHTRAFGTYLLGGVFTLQKKL
jgi:hypothetical protein